MGKKKKTYHEEIKEMAPSEYLETLIRRAGGRLDVHRKRVHGWRSDDGFGEARGLMTQAIGALERAAEAMAKVPKSYQPREPRKTKPTPIPGAKVHFVDKQAKGYAAMFGRKEIGNLTVVGAVGPRLAIRTKSGQVITNVPKTHVAVKK